MHLVTLIPPRHIGSRAQGDPHAEISPNRGAPSPCSARLCCHPGDCPAIRRPGASCTRSICARATILWSVPLGTTEDLAPFSQYVLGNSGTPNMGGPVTAASGLVFIGAAMDDYLRAFDAARRQGIVERPLAFERQATPMTYLWQGRQYVRDRGGAMPAG